MIYRVPCVLPLTHSYNVFVSLKANRILFDIVSIWSCSVAFEYLRERKVSYDNNAVLDLTSGLFVQWDGGGSGVKAESGLNLLLVLSLALRGFSPGTPVFSFSQKPTFQTPIIKLQQLSMDCTLIDHRNDLTMFKAQGEQQAAGELFHCEVKLKKRKQSAPPSRYFHRLYSY